MPVATLKKRAQFLRLRSAPSVATSSFRMVQGTRSIDDKDNLGPRIGFTVTKKLGNAVQRNRIKRRLKSAIEHVFPLQADVNADYVVIARRAAYDRPFPALINDVERALEKLQHKP